MSLKAKGTTGAPTTPNMDFGFNLDDIDFGEDKNPFEGGTEGNGDPNPPAGGTEGNPDPGQEPGGNEDKRIDPAAEAGGDEGVGKVIPNSEFFNSFGGAPQEGGTEDETKGDPDPGQSPPAGDDAVKAAMNTHFNMMKDHGGFLLPDDFKFDGDMNKVIAADSALRDERSMDTLLASLPPKAKEIIAFAINNGGADIDKMTEVVKSTDWEKVTITQENAEAPIREYYALKGLEKEDVDNIIEVAKDTDTLVEKGTKLQGLLVDHKKNTKQALSVQAKQRADDRLRKEQAKAQKVIDVLKANKWKEDMKIDVFQSIYEKDPQTKQTRFSQSLDQIYQDPKALVTLASIISGYNPETREWDMGPITSQAKAETSKDTKKAMEGYFKSAPVGSSDTPQGQEEIIKRFADSFEIG